MTIELTVLIGVLSLSLAFLGYKLNKDKAVREEGKFEGKLDTISAGITEMKLDFKELRVDFRTNEQKINLLGERLTRVEESSKQAHKRIDKLEGREAK